MKTVHIIGGGITGCSLAYALKSNFNVILYEKTESLGGLLKTQYNLENIPYQKGSHIIHTNESWVVDLLHKLINIQQVEYNVAISPLIDFQYYDFPFSKSSLDMMPWHWKESIKLEMEKVDGSDAPNLKDLIINFYGKTIYEIFYQGLIKKQFGLDASLIDTTRWYRNMLKSIQDKSLYFSENSYFPVDEGYNNLFSRMTEGIDVRLGVDVNYSNFKNSDIVVLTTRLDKFFSETPINYITSSFDVDSVLYSSSKPDTIFYPNYVPFLSMTQFGKFFSPDKNHGKNIVIKEIAQDGDEETYPVPTQKNINLIRNIKNKYPIYYAGWQTEYSSLSIAESIRSAMKTASEIKHKESH